MTIFKFFNTYFSNHNISAVYLKTHNDMYDLTFYHQEYDQINQTYCVTNRTVADDLFFKQLSKQFGIGKLQFLKQLHNLSPLHKKYISIPVGGGKYINQYVIIKDVKQYINEGVFNN